MKSFLSCESFSASFLDELATLLKIGVLEKSDAMSIVSDSVTSRKLNYQVSASLALILLPTGASQEKGSRL